ncbi:MAG: hypothetical protein K1X89_16775 [Myxococcaceae bacterium]|nr:hypothetical protein [Myxococcaceae bacterium]
MTGVALRQSRRRRVPLACVAALLWCASAQAAVRPLVFLGPGFPELLHGELGVLVNGRVSVEARVGWVVFNLQTGLAVTGWFLGEATDRPPRHALLGSLELRFNPTLQPMRLRSGGEVLAGSLGTYAGYGFTTEAGFSVRILVGALWSAEQSLAVGPNVTVGLGWIF